ncbi:MAG: hypothetical protein ABSD97_08610 [Acidimicrobiales bacterium]
MPGDPSFGSPPKPTVVAFGERHWLAVVVLAALVGLTTIFLALEPHPGEGGARLTLALVACGPMLLCAGGASRLRGLSSPAPCRP